MVLAYPYVLDPDPTGGFSVYFPDVPEALTQGETEAECATMAADCLATALSFYIDAGEPLPVPSPASGRPIAVVSLAAMPSIPTGRGSAS